ncbi:hypothetical protein IWQ61_003881 [Dispira simplex]|nr:hypothetical protein IWQ61_003881 [Dispira simplex]
MSTLADYPAKTHCRKVVDHLGVTEGVIYLKGYSTPSKGTSDVELPFYQDPNFYYLTGAAEPDLEFVYDITRQHAILFVPKLPQDEIIWVGEQESLENLTAKYPVDEVRYSEDLEPVLGALRPLHIYLVDGAPCRLLGVLENVTDRRVLKQCLEEARLIKTPEEIALMRQANDISSLGHRALVEMVHVGSSENELYARFVYECAKRGGIHQAYGGIVGRGTNAAILHYTRNDTEITRSSDVVLVDAGCEYRGYASDITRVFPVGLKFTEEARAIYQLVLDMQKAALNAIRVGVEWEDIHRLANRMCGQGLIDLGILRGSLQDVLDRQLPAVFFPHGLGHSIGLDVHDVAGYPEGVSRIPEPGLRYLRMRRKLQAGMVVTVEPGCYFVPALLRQALANPEQEPWIDQAVLEKYMAVGGVRIEDCVVVLENGIDNLTTAPKEIAEIEAIRQRASAQ